MFRKTTQGILGAFVVGILFSGTAAWAKTDAAKEKEIRKLLQLTGAAALGEQILAQMLENFKQSLPNVPENFWTSFAKKANTKQLFEQIIPVYDRHLSIEDIKGLVAFYQSELGKKFVAAQPKLMAESMDIGRIWGEKLAKSVADELKKKKLLKE